jgi:hypothetical protein
MIGEMTSLKQELHRDDVKSLWPHENGDSFFHSFPHFMHFTRNFISHTTPAGYIQRETPLRFPCSHEEALIQDFLPKIKHFIVFIKTAENTPGFCHETPSRRLSRIM